MSLAVPVSAAARGRRRLLRSGALLAVLAGTAAASVGAELFERYPKSAEVANEVSAGGLSMTAKVFTSGGWVAPGGDYPIVVGYQAGPVDAGKARVTVVLHESAIYSKSTPAPSGGLGTPAAPLVYELGYVAANAGGKLIIEARAKSLAEDPEAMWKDLSAVVTLEVDGQAPQLARTHGPKVTTLSTARFGDRPFPVVMVQYQDVKHCTGVDEPYPGCGGNHTAAAMDHAVNSRSSGSSLWKLYQDMSFGQLFPIGTVSPAEGSGTRAFTEGYPHKFSQMKPSGTCNGTTVAQSHGTPAYGNRVESGWYLLPGTQGYYGSDKVGHGLVANQSGQGLVAGIDDACGPTGKLVYDAASLADPDIDYNDFDTDKDGVVDFINVMFAGCGGHGCLDPTGPNNIWPHKSDVRAYFTDENGETGYVSNDRLKNHYGAPLFYTDAARSTMTTVDTGIPVYVRVGPYNVNPENAPEQVSVVAHEYGHSLGMPDFYSTGSRSTMGSWELMGTDYFQYMTAYARQRLGWIVPRELAASGAVNLRESKHDTGEIHWTRPDGTPYVLSGAGIHNADAYKLSLPKEFVIRGVPSGVRAWHSGSGNGFNCTPAAGHHSLDLFVPGLEQYGSASAVALKFKSLYEIEWDYDYGFVLVSEDAGQSWTSLPSKNGTTIQSAYNPNSIGCLGDLDNGITGVSGGGANNVANLNRAQSLYPEAQFVDDEYDLTAYKGKSVILRFHYFTDGGLAKRGWFIDDLSIAADGKTVYASDFENGYEESQLFPHNWSRVSTADGVDTDHAYYIELRDRVGLDYDGAKQSERGTPSWRGGVSVIYTNENHGFGNTGVDDPPAQTPVDANPEPGSATPNLDDAAFSLQRKTFDGCKHVDNYDVNPSGAASGPEQHWKLPNLLRFTVTALAGLKPNKAVPENPATATLAVEIYPDCAKEMPAAAKAEGRGLFLGSLSLTLLLPLAALALRRRH